MRFTGSFFLLLLVVFLGACNSQPGNENIQITKTDSPQTPAVEARSNVSFLYDYKAIEEVFGNENWMIVDKNDTSYLYASRLGDYTVNTYNYKIVNGDSALVKHGNMLKGSSLITWEFNNQSLLVKTATGARIAFNVAGSDSLLYEFIRVDADKLQVTYPDKKKLVWKKTLPFSLFLVRSRYDFLHGTKYAFDKTEFTQKHPA